MGAKSQRKGRAAELELCRLLQAQGIPAEPGKPVSFGETPDITGIRGIHAEVKRRETTEIWKWMGQAETDAQRFQDGAATVFFRRSRSPWMVCMELKDWLTLYTAADHNGPFWAKGRGGDTPSKSGKNR